MLSFFDRQKQRREKLAAAIVATDDKTLAEVLAEAAAPEVAVALRVLPLARANSLVEGVPQAILTTALTLSEAGGDLDPEAATKLVGLLAAAKPEAPTVDPHAAPATEGAFAITEAPTAPPASENAVEPLVDDAPLGVRALDLAGRVLGTFSIEQRKH
jgi:hypothetical protein